MKTEFEVRFLEINKTEMESRLKTINARDEGECLQIRKTYDFVPKNENAWIRLRTNGKKVTLTIKEIFSDKIDGTREMEIVVDDFDETDLILKRLGVVQRNIQENRRHRYEYNGTEIVIDTWPLIPTYMEIEGKSEQEIKDICKLLELDYKNSISLDVAGIFKTIYGIDILNIPELKFN